MRRPTTVMVIALLLLRMTPASAQLVEAECPASWPAFPFPEGMSLDIAQHKGVDIAWQEFSAPDSVRAGRPPEPRIPRSTPTWLWHADLAAIARTSDLGLFISRFNVEAAGRVLGVTDGYIISAWAYVAKGRPKLIARVWLKGKNDRRPRPDCPGRIILIPGNFGSAAPRVPDVNDVDAVAAPPAALRDADNTLIAEATCRDRWPPIIEASGESHGRFLVPGVGEVIGGASLRPIDNLLPQEPVRWRRLKFLASRDGKLGLSIGRLVNCDDSNAVQTYVTAWIREGKSWRLEMLAIAP